jgi:DNA polymerase-3 subunit alpha
MTNYVSLHNHTIFSILDSLIKPKDLFEKTKELGQKSVSVTDHSSLSGLYDSLIASKQTGVKLIAGVELPFVNNFEDKNAKLRHIILLAKNAKGYENLLKLVASGYDNHIIAFKKSIPRVNWKLLEKYQEGLICTTACANGIISQLITAKNFDEAKSQAKRLKDIFEDNLAIELQAHALNRVANTYSNQVDQVFINKYLKQISIDLDIKPIVTTNAHYLNKEQAKAHDVVLAISSGQTIKSRNRLTYHDSNGDVLPDFYVKSGDEILKKLTRIIYDQEFAKKCVENTVYFADKCEFPNWIDPKYSNPSGKELPEFPVKDQPDYEVFCEWKNNDLEANKLADDVAYYRYQVELGLQKKLNEGKISADKLNIYKDRIKEELEVLEYHGFSSYMLIVWDYICWAKKNKISVNFGRGSVCGCMTAYFIGIHEVNSIKYNLIFARFHNKEKKSFPDCDTDFSPDGRNRVQKYVSKKYGEDNVAHVSNLITMKPKVYARAIARTFEYGGDRKTAVAIGTAIADSIPKDYNSITKSLKDAALFIEYSKQYKELAEYAELLENIPVAWGTHAAGIVIGKRNLREIVPIRRDKDGNVCLQSNKNSCEDMGLIKMDMLGLETLYIIDLTKDLIKKHGKQFIKEEIPLDDDKTYELISKGDTFGVFQLGTSSGTVELCKNLKPKNIEEISMINSLARPSAKDIRISFIETKNGLKNPEYIHSSVEHAFGSTFGFGLYEESLMYLAQDCAAWNLNQADNLRKLTKEKGKNPEKAKKWRKEFINSCINNGLEKEIAVSIWDDTISSFAGYGFNASIGYLDEVNIYTKDGKFLCVKQISEVIPGDFVKSRDEKTKEDIFVEVLNLHNHGELDLVEVELDTGEKVKCTMDHKFRVKEHNKMLPLWKIIKDKLTIVVNKK